MNITFKFTMMLALIAGLLFSSCKKESEEETPPIVEDKGYSVGVLIANEGAFGGGNGSVSYFDTDENAVTNDLFKTINDFPLGDVLQSVYRGATNTYACVNASNKIEVINSKTFESIATISNLPQPRYAIEKDGKLYVSCWGSGGQIKIIDTNSNEIIDSIMVGSGPESLCIVENNLYVANSGGFSIDSTISVVNLSNNQISSIEVDGYNPASLAVDADNNIWVLAKGNVIYDVNWTPIGHNPSKLFVINSTDNTILKTIDLFADKHPVKIAVSKDKGSIYYGSGFGFDGIFKMDYKENNPSSTAFIDGSFYGFLINEANDEIFAFTGPFGANGVLMRYTANGEKIDEHEVGIFPNGGTSKNLAN